MTKKQISDIQSGIWLIGLAILFISGDWWPGILILIGVSMVAGSLLRGNQEQPATLDLPEQPDRQTGQDVVAAGDSEEIPDPSPRAVSPQSLTPPAPITKVEAPGTRPADRLPETCGACGAPVRGIDVHWIGFDKAQCGFCGSDLKLK